MTELDFDELDKAVNSLMGDVGKTPTQPASKTDDNAHTSDDGAASTDDSATTTVEISLSAPSDSLSTDDKPAVTDQPPAAIDEKNEEKKPASAKPLATKRRGQFMDMIHPSSDMKASAGPIKRQGVTIAPISAQSSTPDAGPQAEQSVSKAEDASVSSSNDTDQSAPKSDWPDPIDLANKSARDEVTTPAQDSSDEGSTPEQPASTPPLESPFLPDAKPDKRPLGGVATTSEPLASESSPADLTADSKGDQSPSVPPDPTVAATAAALPAELHSNVMAVESDTTSPIPPAPAPAETTSESTPAPVADATEPAPQPSVPADVPAGGSISQQYKEEPSTGDQTNGSIYDTAHYHKAIEAHAGGSKSHTVVKTIIWIVLLLVIGVGAGAAYFAFTR